jgi:ribosome-binding factor A
VALRTPGRAPGRRPQRVAEAIREVVAPFLQQALRDPRITGLVTVTAVRVTPDLKHAVVGVAIHGEEVERERTLEGLESAAGLARHEVARKLALKSAPAIHFEIDRGVDHASRIEAVLAALRRAEGRDP